MKILHITPEYPPIIWGGLGTAVGGLTKALSKKEHSIGVLLVGGALVLNNQPYGSWNTFSLDQLKNQLGTENFIKKENVLFFHVSTDQALGTADLLSTYWRPDAIHLHTAWLSPVAERIREKCRCPIVFTVHSIDKAEYEVGNFYNHWEVQEKAINKSDGIIAISQSEKEILNEYYPHVSNKIGIVGNGIDDSRVIQQIVKNREWKKTDLTVLYTGRFVERKGIWQLIAAIPKVLLKFPAARFVLAGGYGGGTEIEKEWLVDILKPFKEKVVFTGWLTPTAVNNWYQKADILVVPSWYEPFGMVVLEGMLYGLPIVATNIGGPSEILCNNKTALLVPPKDATTLSEAIVTLLNSLELRKKLGRAAAKEVRKKWLWSAIIKNMKTTYLDTIRYYKACA